MPDETQGPDATEVLEQFFEGHEIDVCWEPENSSPAIDLASDHAAMFVLDALLSLAGPQWPRRVTLEQLTEGGRVTVRGCVYMGEYERRGTYSDRPAYRLADLTPETHDGE